MTLALGVVVGGVGVVLASLAIPALARRFHVEPVVAPATTAIAVAPPATPAAA